MPSSKSDFKEYITNLIGGLSVDEVQKQVMMNIVSNMIDGMTDKDLEEFKNNTLNFIKQYQEKASVFS